MEPEFCAPIQISSWGGSPKEDHAPQELHWMVPMRMVLVLVLEEKAEYDENEDEESFLKHSHEKLYENHWGSS